MNQHPLDAMIAQISRVSVDPELFVQAVATYQHAAEGSDPSTHIPQTRRLRPGEIRLTDTPINRGMLAVMQSTKAEPTDIRRALALRLMYFMPAVLQAAREPRFRDYVESLGAGNSHVSFDFHRAYAQCRFVQVDGEEMGADLDDLHRILIGGGLS